MERNIISSCSVQTSQVFVNNEELQIQSSKNMTNDEFLTQLYRQQGLNYPKFFKMDVLSKLAFISTEMLISSSPFIQNIDRNDVALVFGNKSSSIVSDTTHQKSIQDPTQYFPSPSVFVYTLPNIMIGEICIRHQFTGENYLFMANSFSEAPVFEYANYLLEEKLCSTCICGWIDATHDGLESQVFIL